MIVMASNHLFENALEDNGAKRKEATTIQNRDNLKVFITPIINA